MAEKKDLDRWCKGKVGVEHSRTLSLDRPLALMAPCGFRGKRWFCVHTIVCSVCHRVLVYEWAMGPSDCPESDGYSESN